MKKSVKFLFVSLFLFISSLFFGNIYAIESSIPIEELKDRFTTGNTNSAYIDNYHNLYTWGHNWYGELFTGDRNDPDQTYPKKVASDIIQVSHGEGTIGVIKADHSLWTAGNNGYGQLGNGEGGKYQFTAALSRKVLDNVKQVSMGESHSAAVTLDGSLYTWGLNNFGQLGKGNNSDTDDNLIPQKVMNNVKSIVCGDRCTAVITNNDELYMFGVNFSGRLGIGASEAQYSPVKILDNVDNVALCSNNGGAVTKDGTLYMWGANSDYQLGIGSTDGKSAYSPVKVMEDVKQVALGQNFTLILKNDGDVYGVGQNHSGSIGTGEYGSIERKPVKILDNVIYILASNMHAQAIKNDGSLWVWGQQLGLTDDFVEENNQSDSPYRLIEGFTAYNKAPSEPSDSESFNITLSIEPVDEYSRTGGKGVHKYYQTAKVTANNLGREFIGWFDGENLVSKDEVYNFVVTRDIHLVAKYVPRESDINPELKSIRINERDLKIGVGETANLTVNFTPENAVNKNITWESINPAVATVENGKVTGINPGVAIIEVRSEDNHCSDTVPVTVIEKSNPSESTPSIYYKTHVENLGWQDYVSNGMSSGTSGRSLRLEGIFIDIPNSSSLGLEYRTHVENLGWQYYMSTNQLAGTTGQALRLEAIQIRLTGADASKYDVYYRVHAQDVGWMNWAKNDQPAGTAGFARRLEAIQIRIMPKGQIPEIPVDTPNATNSAFLQK